MSVSQTHTAMLRKKLKEESASNRPLKRRRKAAPPVEVIAITSESSSDSDLEDVDLDVARATTPGSGTEPAASEKSDSPEASDSDDFDDLEDVDIESVFGSEQQAVDETLTFTIDNRKEEPKTTKKAKRSYKPISKEGRAQRLLVHKLLVFSMLCHGAIRNKWCNDPTLLSSLNKVVPADVKKLLSQEDEDVLDYVKSKRFIDGLRKLSSVYSRKFRCSSPGIERYDWGEADLPNSSRSVTLESFSKGVRAFQGSKDMGAQGFVAILRSVGVDARLVFSIQAPDYRSLKPAMPKDEPIVVEDEPESRPKSEFDPVFIPDSRQELLRSARKRKLHDQAPVTKKPSFNFPVFWIEVWNKYSKKMITIDPIVFKIVEVVPMRRKCKFDAPSSDPSHQTWYVMAYNADGSLRDVTRRYTQFYNAKTAKKRMGSHSEEDEHWYGRIIRAVGTKRNKITNSDALEMKELYDRHICEGTPNNMVDFKNHPVYALESQLRQDEVIYPNNESSKCGTFRSLNKKNVTTIYRRSHVCRLRTPKAWHMMGRVLKVGVQPLKVRKINLNSMTEQDEEEDGEVRMYAEFQTELYIPPPIKDGKIVKNVYGNVEVFTPTMIPENGYLAKISRDVSLKLLEQAARTLNIDYARAIVAFDFSGGSKNSKRAVTPKEGGILIASEYQEAFLAVVQGLKDEEDDKKRESVEMNALRSWKFFLTKLRIIRRLDAHHGKVSEGPEDVANERDVEGSDDEDDYYSVGSDEEGSDNDDYVPRKSKSRQRPNPEELSGGFSLQDAIPDQGELEGGFVLEESGEPVTGHYAGPEDDYEGGGFFAEKAEGSDREEVPKRGAEPQAESASRGTRERLNNPNVTHLNHFRGVQDEEQYLGIEYSDSE